MNISRSLAISVIVGAGIVGIFLGRAISYDTPQADSNPSPLPSAEVSVDDACQAERAALISIKTKLSICMAFRPQIPEAALSDASKQPEPALSAEIKSPVLEMFKNYHDRLDSLSEAVIVQEADGTIGIYKPDEWPIDGNGLIIGRKFPDGQIGWYAGPDVGPRSDPAAFRKPKSTIVMHPDFVREGDGTIRVRPNAPPWMKRRLGEKVDEPDAN